MSAKVSPPKNLKLSVEKKVFFSAFLIVVAVCALEGFAHFVAFGFDYPKWAGQQMRTIHNESRRAIVYDSELGWRGKPNTHFPDFFGAGKALTFNSNGIRAQSEYSAAGRRIMMVGDSFTFGHGVGDRDSFPRQLEDASQIETMNLGMLGYGLDQAYLAYLRMEPQFEHQVLLFGIITDDFRRLLVDRGGDGYYKPRLAWRDGGLVKVGVPVPSPIRNGGLLFPEMRKQYILDYFTLSRFVPFRPEPGDYSVLDRVRESEPLAEYIFQDLHERLMAKGRRLGIVWFPTLDERIRPSVRALYEQHMREFRAFADRRGIPLIDLTGAFAPLSEDECQKCYLPPEVDAWRHPTSATYGAFVQLALPRVRELMADANASGTLTMEMR